MLLILHAWALLAVIPFAYAAPVDAFSILRICDDTDEDGIVGMRVEHDGVVECAGQAPDEVAPGSQRVVNIGTDASASALATCTVHLRAPPIS